MMKKVKGKERNKANRVKKTGRPSAWETMLKDHLPELQEMRSEGATIKQIATRFEVDPATLYRLKRNNKEFQEAMFVAHKNREEGLVGKLWELATGRAVRVEELSIDHHDGKKTTQTRVVHMEPSLPAQLAFLRRFHGWKEAAPPDPMEEIEKEVNEEEQRKRDEKLLKDMNIRLGLDPDTPLACLHDGGPNPEYYRFNEKKGYLWDIGTYPGQALWKGQTAEEKAAAMAASSAGLPTASDLVYAQRMVDQKQKELDEIKRRLANTTMAATGAPAETHATTLEEERPGLEGLRKKLEKERNRYGFT